MAVPKKKTSKSKSAMRKGGNGALRVKLPNVMIDKDTGEYKLSHHVSLDGYYNGKKVIKDKPTKKEETQEETNID
ncbi:MAG: 50S ribosomal protein L32 [Rickettsiales bacterium]|jgi:large subunit ribosomal protein L32|nr:50S ribosomal protein L32 [Rickettsiales bacterium]